ncbi:hypothetical protein ACJX0J_009831, partial [Zea mays]
MYVLGSIVTYGHIFPLRLLLMLLYLQAQGSSNVLQCLYFVSMPREKNYNWGIIITIYLLAILVKQNFKSLMHDTHWQIINGLHKIMMLGFLYPNGNMGHALMGNNEMMRGPPFDLGGWINTLLPNGIRTHALM